MAAGRSTTVIIAVTGAVSSLVFAMASQAGAGPGLPAGMRAAALGGTWHTAQKVPGTATLNIGGNAQVQSVSCASAGSCSAGGYYTDGSGRQQVFVVSRVNGTWRTAIRVPGTATLNKGGNAQVRSVSCASAGNCGAGGFYTDSSGHTQAFAVSQVSGTWRTAIRMPGTATLNQTGNAEVDSVSCASAGNCSAGGQYQDSSWSGQAFVVSQVNGAWRTARQVPGTATLNHGGAWVVSVSCASAGNCGAGGSYYDSSGHRQVFVVSQVNGTWRTAIQVPGTATLNSGGGADIYSVSCASVGNCTAGGTYWTDSGHAFVVSQVNGTWRTAIEVPGTATLSQGNGAVLASISCTAAGTCGAGGWYQDGSGHTQAFVVSQVNGTWRTASRVPGAATLNSGGAA
jgi:uncharacterized protein YunC (DUF1805 family)